MAKKKTNEIVEEQRRAREEFLELKRMQMGEMPTGPKPSEEAVAPKTFSEKVKNIWYHDKYPILGGLAACIIIVILVAQCCTRVKPDLQMVVFSYTAISDASCDKIAALAEKYCDDINGDGKIKVQVVNCSFNENGDTQYRYTVMQKLQTMIAAGSDTVLYITDEKGAAYFSDSNGAFAECFEGEFKPLGSAFYDACKPDGSNVLEAELPEGLRAACRKTGAQVYKKEKHIKEYEAASEKLLEKFTE